MSENKSPEFEERIHSLLAEPDADAAFVSGLRSKLIERNKVKTIHRFSPRLAWGIAIVLVLLIIGLLLFSPRAVEAMRRLLGYIPGVGYVERGSTLRILSAPVTLQKDGLTLTIKEGAADSQRTVLLAQIEGFTQERYQAQNGVPTCKDLPRLVSADGSVQETGEIDEHLDQQNDAILFIRYEFLAMPADQLDAALEIPCPMWDENYRDWKIPLHFQVADGTHQVAPVIELPTSLPTQPAPTGVSTPAAESAPAGFSIILKNVAELKDGYVLSGGYQWSDTRIDRSAVVVSSSNIVDAQGQDVPYDEVDTGSSADSGPQQIPFAYQITGKKFAWPLHIIAIAISVIQPGQGTFQFDAGPDPHAGQTWDVNIDVPVGRHIIHVQTIQVMGGSPKDPPNVLGFEFTMTSDPAVASALVRDMNPIIDCKSECGGSGGGGQDFGVSGFDGATGPFVDGWESKDYSPAGLKTFVISDVSIFFKGPWQVTWQPSSP
jgi:hypothetical protein